jgi:hypothetical protein
MSVASWWNTFPPKSANVAGKQSFREKPLKRFAGSFTMHLLPGLSPWMFSHWLDRILAAKTRDAGADVSAREREIDQLVYALYGLTLEEIQIAGSASASARQGDASR